MFDQDIVCNGGYSDVIFFEFYFGVLIGFGLSCYVEGVVGFFFGFK